jgi:hypothetical protein
LYNTCSIVTFSQRSFGAVDSVMTQKFAIWRGYGRKSTLGILWGWQYMNLARR